jgi:DNA-binding GntR family transcriptional regulator
MSISPALDPTSGRPTRSVRPIGQRSTVEQVTIEIRRALLDGTLVPGEEFSMAELSTQLNVSHIPVREALRRLEAQGLVTLRPGRLAVVPPLDADEIEDVYRLWILLSNEAAARACVRYTDEDIERIEAALLLFTGVPQESEEAFAGHREFHLQLLKPGASVWDLRLLDILWHVIERAVRVAYQGIVDLAGPQDPGAQAYEEHRPLLDAARTRDPARLQRALRNHHESHMQLVVAALEATDGERAR